MREAGRSMKGSPHHELYDWAGGFDDVEEDGAERHRGAPLAQPTHAYQGYQRDLMYVFDKYICKRAEGAGVTIMLHDVPYRFQVDPDVFTMIKSIGNLDTVDYVYLPMAVDRPSAIQCRNKG